MNDVAYLRLFKLLMDRPATSERLLEAIEHANEGLVVDGHAIPAASTCLVLVGLHPEFQRFNQTASVLNGRIDELLGGGA